MRPVALLVWLSPLQKAWTLAGANQTFSPRQQKSQQPGGSRPHGLQSQREGPQSWVWEWAQSQQDDWGESPVRRKRTLCYFLVAILGFVLIKIRVQVLTVLQSRCRTIFAAVHRSPGLRQTVVKIWRRELMEDSFKLIMWNLTFLRWLHNNYSHHSKPHFTVMKPL